MYPSAGDTYLFIRYAVVLMFVLTVASTPAV